MAEIFSPYDPASALVSDEAIAIFLADAFETNDAAHIAAALADVARAKGDAALAEQAGLDAEELRRSLRADGNLTLSVTLAILRTAKLQLIVEASPEGQPALSALALNETEDADSK
jgi:probable addiction module antidote protein